RPAPLPYPERRKRCDRTGEEGGRAVVVGRRRGDEQSFDPSRGKCDSGNETGRPATDDRDFGREPSSNATHDFRDPHRLALSYDLYSQAGKCSEVAPVRSGLQTRRWPAKAGGGKQWIKPVRPDCL